MLDVRSIVSLEFQINCKRLCTILDSKKKKQIFCRTRIRTIATTARHDTRYQRSLYVCVSVCTVALVKNTRKLPTQLLGCVSVYNVVENREPHKLTRTSVFHRDLSCAELSDRFYASCRSFSTPLTKRNSRRFFVR